MVATTPSTIMPLPSCDKKLTLEMSVHFGVYLTLLRPWPLTFWPQNLMSSSLTPKSISGESLVKFCQQIRKISC